ncbi:hypothetical protein H8E77_41070 [bacterium]|nr:hypothetical protein [bacterium]
MRKLLTAVLISIISAVYPLPFLYDSTSSEQLRISPTLVTILSIIIGSIISGFIIGYKEISFKFYKPFITSPGVYFLLICFSYFLISILLDLSNIQFITVYLCLVLSLYSLIIAFMSCVITFIAYLFTYSISKKQHN